MELLLLWKWSISELNVGRFFGGPAIVSGLNPCHRVARKNAQLLAVSRLLFSGE